MQNKVQTQNQISTTPLQIRLINLFGLRNYLFEHFIFRRKPSKYTIRKINQKNVLQSIKMFNLPSNYSYNVEILELGRHSVPTLIFKPKTQLSRMKYKTIIYAHGNSSDLSEASNFISKICSHILAQFVIFDYSGYGQSRATQIDQDIICKDLQIVISWLQRAPEDIILWGFSLGSYPALMNAVNYQVRGIILQCPLASICSLFQSQCQQKQYAEDYFSNIEIIQRYKGHILLIHSSQDEIIPFRHSKLLLDRYQKSNTLEKITLIEVSKLKHNSLHKFISSAKQNELQKQVFAFLRKLNTVSSSQFIPLRLREIKNQINLSVILQSEDENKMKENKDHDDLQLQGNQSNCFCFNR